MASKSKKHRKQILFAVIAVAVIAAGFGVFHHISQKRAQQTAAQYQKEEKKTTPASEKTVLKLNGQKYTVDHPVKTYLFMGTDNSGAENELGEKYEGSMADFLLLVTVDEQKKTCGYIQLNRDTICKIHLLDQNGEGEATADIQLCIAHWYGGSKEMSAQNTERAVSDLLGGIDIDGYYTLPMSEISKLNDLVDIIKKKSSDDSQFAVQLFTKLQDVSTTDMTTDDIYALSQAVSGARSKGILQLKGKNKEGDTLNDGEMHAEFYASKSSIADTVKALYPLTAVQKEKEKTE
ncbi:MAG: LCP family protein [Eubacterium sp.]|jgi:flagellar basal body-associated protein FliL